MDLYDKVVAVLDEKFGIDPEEISLDATFEELDLDSLDLVQFSMEAEDEFGIKISDTEASTLKTVADAVRLLTDKGADA